MQVKTFSIYAIRDSTIEYTGADKIVQCPEDVFGIFREYFKNLDREHLVVLALSTHGSIIGLNTVAIGSLESAIVEPREVFKFAILANAASIIIAHNHPSGNCEPSNADIVLTYRLADAGSLLGIELLDHIIIAGDSFKRIAFVRKEYRNDTTGNH